MREIKFRGKSLFVCDWHIGLFSRINGQAYIEEGILKIRVKEETVGQYTGLKDKNGVEIYEGDIVCSKFGDKIIDIGDVQFDCGVFGVEWICNKNNRNMVGSWGQRHNLRKLDDDFINEIEVIGNIYDNPELLDGEEE